MEKMSMSNEDYLEAVVELSGLEHAPVRSVDLAETLSVSKASVNKAVAVLKREGYVDQQPYGDIVLTEAGIAYGTSVLDRHKLLLAFLTQVVGIDEGVADEEACKMEHAISDESFQHWVAYADRIGLKHAERPAAHGEAEHRVG